MAWPCLWPAITTIAVYMMVVHGPVSNHLVQKDHAERVEVAKRVARKSGMVMLVVVVVVMRLVVRSSGMRRRELKQRWRRRGPASVAKGWRRPTAEVEERHEGAPALVVWWMVEVSTFLLVFALQQPFVIPVVWRQAQPTPLVTAYA